MKGNQEDSDNEGGIANELLTEAKELRKATVKSMIKEIAFLKMVVRLLGIATALMVFGVGILCYRTFFVTGPTVENTNEIVTEVKDNSKSLEDLSGVVDELKMFVDQIKGSDNRELQNELQKSIFDIRTIMCAKDSALCRDLGIVPRPRPTTSTSSPP